jgi:hypothetical protein
MAKVKILLVMVLIVSFPIVLLARRLQLNTLSEWDEFIRDADLLAQSRLNNELPFLWIDESASRQESIRQGTVLVVPVISHGIRPVQGGLIHDWIGGIFIPGATTARLRAVTHGYDRYKEFYKPLVTDSTALSCMAAQQRFSMTWHTRVSGVAAAMTGEYEVRDVRIDAHRGYTIATTVRIQEIENYGNPGQRLLPPDTGRGLIWRLHSISRYEERDGGVYLETEAFALTREIPFMVRWFVTPIVNRVSINSLTTMLSQTKDAVTADTLAGTPTTSCGFDSCTDGTDRDSDNCKH